MSNVIVTVKLTPAQFDLLRSAVTFTRDYSRNQVDNKENSAATKNSYRKDTVLLTDLLRILGA